MHPRKNSRMKASKRKAEKANEDMDWRQLRVVSLFSGCGGLDLGFKEEGFELAYACDNDPIAVEVYRRNVDERAYVRDVTTEQFHREIDEIGYCDVVLGGFPCQGFSKAGPKTESDPRNVLYREMLKTVLTLKPKVFVAENVDGMSQNYGGAFVERIKEDFGNAGYRVESRILQAADYGVPQYRRRILFIGVRKDIRLSFIWPEPKHATPLRNGEFKLQSYGSEGAVAVNRTSPPTIEYAIGDLLDVEIGAMQDHVVTDKWPDYYQHVFEAIKPGQKLCNVRRADTSVYTWQIPDAFGKVTSREKVVLETVSKNRRHKRFGNKPNGNPLSLEVIEELSGLKKVAREVRSLVKKNYLKDYEGRYDLMGAMFCSGLFKRPQWDEPAPTVLTVFDNPRYFLHPIKNRPFSVRECARLQSFPDAFKFCDGTSNAEKKAAYRLIGNAVPPLLAKLIANAVKRTLVKERAKGASKFVSYEAAVA